MSPTRLVGTYFGVVQLKRIAEIGCDKYRCFQKLFRLFFLKNGNEVILVYHSVTLTWPEKKRNFRSFTPVLNSYCTTCIWIWKIQAVHVNKYYLHARSTFSQEILPNNTSWDFRFNLFCHLGPHSTLKARAKNFHFHFRHVLNLRI